MLNLAMVLPAMDFIDEMFTNGVLNKQALSPAIHATLGLTKKTLNQYYARTDMSEVYWIVMGMCSLFKNHSHWYKWH